MVIKEKSNEIDLKEINDLKNNSSLIFKLIINSDILKFSFKQNKSLSHSSKHTLKDINNKIEEYK